jgi:LuxR family maltose regulon positive regulatory protein
MALQSSQSPPTQAILTTLINEIAAIPVCFVLVLDDYHLIDAQPVHDGIGFLLDHQPPNLHLVVASRVDLPLPLARLRSRGQMTELRAADLRFTTDEAAAFLNTCAGLKLSDADVAALEARTEGWIAGLQMAALSMQDHSFLLETSILDRMSGPLCDAVTGRDDGQELLERLDGANLFVVPLDDERRWYRYHHLFADLLLRRLRQAQPDLVQELHRRAFDWYKDHHLHQDALHHAIAGQDFERAADLIEAVGIRVMARGALTTVRNWITALPESLVRERPRLCVLHAWTLNLTNQWNSVEPRLQDAERAMAAEDGSSEMSGLRGQIAAIRAYDARRRNDLSLSIQLLQKAQAHLAPDNLAIRTAVSQSLGQTYLFAGDLRAAVSVFRDAQSLGQASGNELAGLVATGQQAAILIAQGQLRQAAEFCRAAINRYLDQHNKPAPVLCHLYTFLGQILYEWNDPQPAVAHLARSVLWSDQIGYGPYGAPVRLATALMGWVRQAQEARGESIALPEQVRDILDRMPADIGVVDIAAWRVRLWIAEGNLAAAARWAEARRTGKCPPGAWPVYGDLALVRVLIAQQKPEQALDVLSQVRQSAEAAGGTGWLIEALTLEALIHQAAGHTDRALAALERALTLAEPEGYVRIFADEGEPMAVLLRQAASRGIAVGYAGKLLAAFTDLQTCQPATLIEPLSERELQVLCLIATGLSNRQIADTLFLAIGTVKKHTNNIYGKLGVGSRTQAILRAAELNLIPPQQASK